ncbi:Nramp family divalent metal transporter [bacterium]|nr:Nramp family divalent metal transporter [bacterium]
MSGLKKQDFWKQIGISVVTIGLGIGSGEFILWPYLSYHWGFSILWGALLGIAMQVFLNIEIQRYAVVTGNSLLKGAYGLSNKLGTWFLISTILGFGWPGFIASAGFLMSSALALPESLGGYISLGLLLLAGLILVVGRGIYQRIEKLLKVIVPVSFIVIFLIFIRFFDWTLVKELLAGLIGVGVGGVDSTGFSLSMFLGAIVYSGSGGNLLLSQAFYALEKRKFSHDFQEHRKFQIFENVFVFGGIGLLTILMLSYLSRVLTLPLSSVSNDLTFLVVEGYFIGNAMGKVFEYLFLFTGVFALFAVQLGVLDLFGRVCRELFHLKFGKDSFQIYVIAVLMQVMVSSVILLAQASQPLWLLVIGSVFNALAMGVIAIVTLVLNMKLREANRPSKFVVVTQFAIALFYIIFFVITVKGGI